METASRYHLACKASTTLLNVQPWKHWLLATDPQLIVTHWPRLRAWVVGSWVWHLGSTGTQARRTKGSALLTARAQAPHGFPLQVVYLVLPSYRNQNTE